MSTENDYKDDGDSLDDLPVNEEKISPIEYQLLTSVLGEKSGRKFDFSDKQIVSVSIIAAVIFAIIASPMVNTYIEKFESLDNNLYLKTALQGVVFFSVFSLSLKLLSKTTI